MSGVQHMVVEDDGQEMRLDRWFRKHFPHISQIKIEKLCRKGEIRVDGGRVKPATRLAAGQDVRVPPLPEPEENATPREVILSDEDIKIIQDAVLFKDEHLIVLNKPAGVATQGGTGQTRHIDMLSVALKFGMDEKPRLVHRLDLDTSGVLLLARTGRAAALLTKAFQSRDTRKIYWALVAGCPEEAAGTIRFGLVKQGGMGAERMVCIHPNDIDKTPDAKRATTDYATIEKVGTRTAWLGLSPITGRTHQLRAHLAEIGCPIVGDGKYGGRGQENMGDGWGSMLGGDISRKMHLHARSIAFTHPFTGKEMFFEAPLPDHMQRSFDYFGWNLKWAPKDPFKVFE